MQNKRVFSLLIAYFLTQTAALASFTEAFARDYTSYAVYLNSGFYMHNSGQINGSLYIANGDARFDSSGGNIVTGDIILSPSHNAVFENIYSEPSIGGSIIKQETTFDPDSYSLPDFPAIDNYIRRYTADYYPAPSPVSEDTHFGTLTVNSDNFVFDATSSNLTIAVDNLVFGGNGKIKIKGDNKVYLYVKNAFSIDGSASVNQGGLSDQLYIFCGSNITFGGSTAVYGNLYTENGKVTFNNGTLHGNILSKTAEKITITGGGTQIYGLVFLPNADVHMSSGAKIYGALVASTLDISGGSTLIEYRECTFKFPPAPQKKFKVTVTVTPEGAGTVTPSEILASCGERISFSVSANEGYTFKGFESDDVEIVDSSVVVTGNISIVAVFEEILPPDDEDEEPVLSPVELKFPYAYMYGYNDEEGNSGARDPIKREEAAALIYRLMKLNDKTGSFVPPETPTFVDLPKKTWSYAAIEYMTSIGVFDTSRRDVAPIAPICRGEVAKIVSMSLRIYPDPDKEISFKDLDRNNPYYKYIKALVDKGVLRGYGDGTIRPYGNMTRAEFITLFNKIIKRDDRYDIRGLECPFPDVRKKDWFYEDIMRAAYGFTDEPNEEGYFVVDPSRKLPRESIDYS